MNSPDPTMRAEAPKTLPPADPSKDALVAARPTWAVARGLWAWALAPAVLAGLGSWAVGEAAYKRFNPVFVAPPGFDKLGPYEQRDARADFERTTTPPAEQKNSIVAYGVLGTLLGAGLGLVGALARRPVGNVAKATLVGLLAGGVAGTLGSLLATPLFFRFLEPESGLLLPFLTHAAIWAAIGAAGGMALAIGLGDRASIAPAFVGGLFGALLGTVIFEAVGAVAFPLIRVSEPIPGDRYARLTACLCVAVLAALGAAIAVQDQGRARKKPQASPLDA